MILVISPKNVYAAKRLAQESAKLDIGLDIMEAGELGDWKNIDIGKYNALYVRNPFQNGRPDFLPQIIGLANKFRTMDKRVVDGVIADGDLGRGKWEDYKGLSRAEVGIPGTQLLWVKGQMSNVKCPFVAKWIYGMKGKGTFLIKSESDIRKIPNNIPRDELMAQEYIDADFEYKVVTVGYKALPVILRYKMKDERFMLEFANFEVLRSENCKELVEIAQNSSKALKRELAKVDILQKGNNWYVLEVNRFPGLEGFEAQAKFNVFAEFLAYLRRVDKNGKVW